MLTHSVQRNGVAEELIVLGRRTIEPRIGFWGIPAGRRMSSLSARSHRTFRNSIQAIASVVLKAALDNQLRANSFRGRTQAGSRFSSLCLKMALADDHCR